MKVNTHCFCLLTHSQVRSFKKIPKMYRLKGRPWLIFIKAGYSMGYNSHQDNNIFVSHTFLIVSYYFSYKGSFALGDPCIT